MTIRILALLLTGQLLAACSSTEMLGSWSNTEYRGQLKNVYIIGIAKNETNRRIFEDSFTHQLVGLGVAAVSSYKDLPADAEADKELIARRMIANGCDSVLLTKLVGQRTETVTNPGYVSGYSSGSYYRGGRPSYYNRWDNFYGRRYDVVYQPATTTEFVVLTVESVLYDLKTEELIWSAQLETIVEGNIEKMMRDYVVEVTKDLQGKGLLQ